jgi:hypothetical protein
MVFGILTRFIWPRDKSNCTFCEMVKKDDFQTQIVAEVRRVLYQRYLLVDNLRRIRII